MKRSGALRLNEQQLSGLVFFIFFVFVLVQLSFVFLYADDYGYLSLSEMSAYPGVDGAQFTLPQLIGFLRLHYLTWGGRVLWFFIMICLLRLGLWPARLALALGIALVFYLAWQICLDNAHRTVGSAAAFCSLYGLLQLRLISDGVFWFSAAYFYVLPLAVVLYAVSVCLRAVRGEKPSRSARVFSFICAFAGGWSQEHVAAAFLGMLGVLFLFCLFRDRCFSARARDVFLTGLFAAAGAAILLLAPGNGARLLEISGYYPDGLIERVLFGLRNILRAVFSSRTALPLYALFLLAALLSARGLRRRRHAALNILCLAFHAAFVLVYTRELCHTDSIYFSGAATIKYAVCCCALAAAVLQILAFLYEERCAGALVLFSGAAAAITVCGATVTVSERTLLPSVLLLLFCIGCALVRLNRAESSRLPRVLLAAILATAIVNAGYITTGYARNYGTVVANDAVLRQAAEQYSATGSAPSILLHKLPDYRFSGTQLYFEDQMWMLAWFCEYYELPADVQIEYR
ncbi:MAG: DUF6056 family protein [Oscillospiraceae bacterium]|nr:DUF6056 family protein [Oscillospiraceae bacterium]